MLRRKPTGKRRRPRADKEEFVLKIQLVGTTRMLGNTPEEIVQGMLEQGYMDPSTDDVEAYLVHLEEQAAARFDFEADTTLPFDARCEQVIVALSEAGELDILED